MITFSDNPQKEVQEIRENIIKQLLPRRVFRYEDFEDLFHCEITGLNVPNQEKYKEAIELFRKEFVVSLIQTSAENYSFYEVAKIFHSTTKMNALMETEPYKYLKDTPISRVPQGLLDREDKEVYATLLNALDLEVSMVHKTQVPLFQTIERIPYKGKSIIDTQTIREKIMYSYLENNPKSVLYQEDYGNLFKATGCYYHNQDSRNLYSRSLTLRKTKSQTVVQIIENYPNLTYEAIGKVFNRTRSEIREYGRMNGVYRPNNNHIRQGEVVKGMTYYERRKEREQQKKQKKLEEFIRT